MQNPNNTKACPEKREIAFTFGQNMKVQDQNEFWILNRIRSLQIQMCQNKNRKCKKKKKNLLSYLVDNLDSLFHMLQVTET